MSEMHALVTLPAEVHSIPGTFDAEQFVSDRPHEMTPDCDCKPVVYWDSAAAPKPLYEHRNVDGQLAPDDGIVQ